jgi:hypothetical protein
MKFESKYFTVENICNSKFGAMTGVYRTLEWQVFSAVNITNMTLAKFLILYLIASCTWTRSTVYINI